MGFPWCLPFARIARWQSKAQVSITTLKNWRPDRQPISTFEHLVSALTDRLEYFIANGCRAADHGIGQLDRPMS
ncbi:glucuronate isomerase [Halomonas sp. PA16-9]|uniref:glucuronate isomerase n=1 Tax=Halomonas sp. PA16-9 TaxID=2576841 RepID=UPI0030EF8A16